MGLVEAETATTAGSPDTLREHAKAEVLAAVPTLVVVVGLVQTVMGPVSTVVILDTWLVIVVRIRSILVGDTEGELVAVVGLVTTVVTLDT